MATAKTHPDNDPIAGEEPSDDVIWYYECTSSECNLRFPAPPMKSLICPFCKADVKKTIPSCNYQTSSQFDYKMSPGFSILLDNLRSVYNVGSILRTSDGAGITHAYLGGITPTPLHPRLAKTALSAEIHTSWSHHPNGASLVNTLKQSGAQLIGLETSMNASEIFVADYQPAKNTVLIVGNEISGIDPAILEQCDSVFYLPMLGNKKSLNVSVSFGIAAYHLIFNRARIASDQHENPLI
jgi:23S rRNA (guanosine2251-2'-O)-methyltransferase